MESTPEKYEFKDSKQSGAALLFALMPVFLADEECNEKYQELKAHRDNGYPDLRTFEQRVESWLPAVPLLFVSS